MKFKEKPYIWNRLAGISFFLSSASILWIPALRMKDGEFPVWGYVIAGSFWGFLLLGIGILFYLRWKFPEKEFYNEQKRRWIWLIAAAVFLLLLVGLVCFFRKNTFYTATDLACLCFSLEFYFVRKRGFHK